jgi:hypothetical protein
LVAHSAANTAGAFIPSDLLQRLILEHLISDDPLELLVLALEPLQPLRVVGLHPAVLVAPPVIRLLGDLQRLGDLRNRPAVAQQPIGLPQLADHLLRRVPASLHQSSFLAHDHGREKLSQGSDRTQGVRPIGLLR